VRYKLLGQSGCRVSELCLGTMTFGRHDLAFGTEDPRQIREVFDAFAEAGGNFVDTSDVYTAGESERFVGEAIAADREHWVVATKYSASLARDPAKAGNSRKHMVEAVEASLRRLGTDHIDLYFVHLWDGLTPVEEVVRGLDDLVRQGKVVYTGLSNAPAWVCSRAATIAELRGWAPLVAIQVWYSLLERTSERELLPMARALDVAVTAYSPLGGGVLTGKHLDGATGDTRRSMTLDERSRRIVTEVVAVAEELGTTPARVALAWLRGRPGVVIPIVGARHAAQLRDSLAGVDVTLEPAQRQRLDEVSAVEPGYPQNHLVRDRPRQLALGVEPELIDVHRPLLEPAAMSGRSRDDRP
jgi:aryl-alcohol dehydrogenase-like predicted oxidoreductase